MPALAVKPKLASRQKTSFDADCIIGVARLVADLHQGKDAANDGHASARLEGGLNTYVAVGNNPLRYVDPDGLLTVNIWKYRGSNDAWGHVSITLDNGRHISWWPSADRQGLLKSLDIYSAPAIPDQKFMRDVFLERQAPDYRIRVEGLDETAIENWWDDFRQSNEWKTLSQNCSTTGADALKAGGAAKYANWWRLHNLIWTPNDVKALTESINRGLLEVR